MVEEHGGKTDGIEHKMIEWMVQQHAGMEMTMESSMEKACRRELDNYLDYIWKRAAHEPMVSAKYWWWRREYLWPRLPTLQGVVWPTKNQAHALKGVFKVRCDMTE